MKIFKIFCYLDNALMLYFMCEQKAIWCIKSNYKQCIENAGERQRQIQDLQAANAGLTSENNLLRDQNGALKIFTRRLFVKRWEKVLLILIN